MRSVVSQTEIEDLFEILGSNLPVGVCIIQDEKFRYINPNFLIYTGYREDELLGKDFLTIVIPEDREMARENATKMLKEEPASPYQFRVACKDGSSKLVMGAVRSVQYHGREAILAIYRDIPERKQAEEKYKILADHSADIIYRLRLPDEHFSYVSLLVEHMLGYTVQEALALQPKDVLTPESYELQKRQMLEDLENGVSQRTLQLDAVHKDGHIIPVELHANFISDETGQPVEIVGVVHDITERKQAEEALQQSEEKFRLLAETSVMGTYILQDFKMVYVNPSFAKVFGYRSEEIINIMDPSEFIHPDDKDLMIQRLTDRYTGRVTDNYRSLRGVKKDGSIIYIEASAVLTEYKGKPAVMGTFIDITERKQTEEALRKSEECYRQLAENACEAILVVQDGMIRFSNPKGAELSGYSIEELTSKPFVEFIYPDDSAMVADNYLRRLKGDALPQTYDFRVTRKDGAIRWAEINAVLISWDNRPAVLCFISDITDRKKTEEELIIKDTALESSVNAVAMADMEGNLTYVNNAFLNWWGYKDKKQVLGKPSTGFWQVVDAAEEVQNAVQKEGGWTGELSAKRKDDTFFDVQLSSSSVKNKTGKPICLMASFVDITERKRTEEALRQSEENYRALFDSAIIGTIVLDAETMKVLIANQAAAKIFGFSSVEEALEADPFDFILPEDKERVSELAEEALFEQNAQLTYDLRILTKDGRKRWISATGARIVHQGRLAGLISFTDITEKKQQNERFMLADRLASIGELAAGAAHELNNPLTSVIGFSQLLMEKDIPDDIREDLEIIYSEAQRAAGVTKNLLAFARKHKPVKQLNQINSIIEDVLKLRTYEHKIKGIEVEKQLASDLPESMVDHFQMQQVFFNIVINAEYFMAEAHDRGTLTITTENHNGTMRISFADDGPGIPLENLSQIFNPFFTTKQTGKGTGLGLSICHGVVSEHGGQIYAKSEPGEGTTIFVELPINGHR